MNIKVEAIIQLRNLKLYFQVQLYIYIHICIRMYVYVCVYILRDYFELPEEGLIFLVLAIFTFLINLFLLVVCYLAMCHFLLAAVSAMLALAKQCAFEEPSVETISGENVLTWPHVVSPLV